jgi:hypothetical protein
MTDAARDRYMAKIANSAERLAALLRHQEPGLLSWASDVRQHAEIVVNWWNGEQPKPEPQEMPVVQNVVGENDPTMQTFCKELASGMNLISKEEKTSIEITLNECLGRYNHWRAEWIGKRDDARAQTDDFTSSKRKR